MNERIGDLAEHLDFSDAMPLLCECGTGGCTERLELTRTEYEQLRHYPTRFAVLPGHQIPGVERVVEEHEGFLVVEKLGDSAVVACRLDPRSHRSGGAGR